MLTFNILKLEFAYCCFALQTYHQNILDKQIWSFCTSLNSMKFPWIDFQNRNKYYLLTNELNMKGKRIRLNNNQ